MSNMFYDLMSEQQWLDFFNESLFKNGIISDDEYLRFKLKINTKFIKNIKINVHKENKESIKSAEAIKMSNWLPPKKAAQYFANNSASTYIREHTIRNLIKDGFPNLEVGNRNLIDVESFDENLKIFEKNKTAVDCVGGIRRITSK